MGAQEIFRSPGEAKEVKRMRFLTSGVWISLACVVLLGACAPKRPVMYPGDTGPKAPGQPLPSPPKRIQLLDLQMVDREIKRREGAVEAAKAKRGELAGTNRAVLEAWITAVEDQIRLLRDISSQARDVQNVADPLEQSRRASQVASLLMDCVSLAPLEPPYLAGGKIVEETKIPWDQLREGYQKGDCNWFLQEYEVLTKVHPQGSIPSDIEVMRGVCLGKLGRKREALGILESRAVPGRLIDPQQIHYLTANWLFEEGELEKAEGRYKALLEGMEERTKWSELARLRLEQIRLKKGEVPPPRPTEGPTVAKLPEPQGAPEPPQVSKSQEPEPPPITFPPREPVAPPQGAPPVAGLTPPAPGPSKPALPPSTSTGPQDSATGSPQEVQVARLKEAQVLLDEERYEEAISLFSQVQSQELKDQAAKGIQEAQDRYAEKKRKEAAALVLKAREEGGPSKKANLIKALEILEETNRKYPANRYAAKIDQNIKDVIAQIRAIDPNFRR